MAFYPELFLLLLGTTCLAQAFQPLPEQQRLKQGESRDSGISGDASLDNFVRLAMHEYHVPGLSLAVIDDGQISTKAMLNRLVGRNHHFADRSSRAMGPQTSQIPPLHQTHSTSLGVPPKPSRQLPLPC